jgi:hypothetical protein
MARAELKANAIVETELGEHIQDLEKRINGDALSFTGPLVFGAEKEIRDALERLHKTKRRGDKLYVILETPGGYIETAEAIVNVLRHHYRCVCFLIPTYAMSAGTVLVMSGNSIHMDYSSVLGPIDPQVERPDGKMVPALGYLAKYDELVEKSRNHQLTAVEAAYLVERFDPAEMHQYAQARDLTIDLLKDWLVKYKFRTWKKTQRRQRKVTRAMKLKRAEEIAACLNKTELWHSHGRGICMEVLRRKVGLQIEDFGSDTDLSRKISSYHALLKDYQGKLDLQGLIHTRAQFIPLAFGYRR